MDGYIFIYIIYNIIIHRPHDSPSHYEAVNAAECNCNVGNYFIKTSIELRPDQGLASNEHLQPPAGRSSQTPVRG